MSYSQDVKSKVSALEKKAGKGSRCSTLHDNHDFDISPLESGEITIVELHVMVIGLGVLLVRYFLCPLFLFCFPGHVYVEVLFIFFVVKMTTSKLTLTFCEETEVSTYSNDDEMAMEQWEEILFKLNDSKRYRQTVGSIASSCLTAATPLLASGQLGACLVALDIVEVC